MPISVCLNCREIVDGATDIKGDDAVPKPGDLSVCIYCQHLMVFGDDLVLRNPIEAEIVEIAGHPALIETQRLVAAFRKHRRRRK